MLPLFDNPWAELTLDSVARFLADAEDEPLQWEAKGTKLDPHAVRKTAGAFANSHDGGYLILGATQSGDAWELDGVGFPGGEPSLWISETLRGGLRPAPEYDVKPFAAAGGRHVAIIWVAPLATPPCVTRGTVYERLPGQSVPIKDPQRLADLYARGDRAHTTAQAGARAAAERAWRRVSPDITTGDERVKISVGVCHVARPADVTMELFTRPFMDQMLPLVEARTRDGPYKGRAVPHHAQDGFWMLGESEIDDGDKTALVVTRDTTAAIARERLGDGWLHEQDVAREIVAANEECVRLAEELGARGDYYMTALLVAKAYPGGSWPLIPPCTIVRGPLREPLNEAQQQQLKRELRRLAGQFAWQDE